MNVSRLVIFKLSDRLVNSLAISLFPQDQAVRIGIKEYKPKNRSISHLQYWMVGGEADSILLEDLHESDLYQCALY